MSSPEKHLQIKEAIPLAKGQTVLQTFAKSLVAHWLLVPHFRETVVGMTYFDRLGTMAGFHFLPSCLWNLETAEQGEALSDPRHLIDGRFFAAAM